MSSSSKVPRRNFLIGALAGSASLAAAPRSSTPPQRKLRYGVVGSGNRACGAHLPILRRYIPEVEIVALCDVTPENLHQGLALCGLSTAGYSDHRQMLAEHPDLDAVIVAVPNYMHAEITVDAFNAGMHVLTEKPMATHLFDADRMIAAAREHQKILQVGFQMRYLDSIRRMDELIRQGAIGDLEYVFGSVLRGDWNPRSWQYTDPVTGKKTNWRYLTFTSGSSLLEEGIHEFDIIHWLVGAVPERIEAQGGNNVYRDRETIDNAGLLIRFANGVKCTFAFAMFTPDLTNGVMLRLLGSKGDMSVESDGEKEFVVVHHYVGGTDRIPVPYVRPEEEELWKGSRAVGDYHLATYREHKAFMNSVLKGAQPFVDGQVGRDAAHISLAAERSLRTGRPVRWDEEDL